MGLAGVEPATSPLSGVRSNQLSYRPEQITRTNAPIPHHGTTISARARRPDPGNLCGHSSTPACAPQHLFKEVIQPQVPLRLPCYDFTPVINHTVVNAPPKVKLSTSGAANSHGVTGGVYKARERIHRDMLIRDY